MKNNIFQNNQKLSITFFSIAIISVFSLVLYKIITYDFISDNDGKEKYSILDQVIYKIRCNDTRNIRLRELKPNHDYVRKPQSYPTLEAKEYQLRTDSNGFIKPSFIHQNPQIQIFFLGGSTTECENVDEEYRFPYLTGRILEQKLKLKINSDNGAKSGNNSIHSINIIINKLLPLNPDVIVLMHNINDLSALFFEGSYWNNNPTISTISCANKNIDRNLKNDQWKYSSWYNKLLANKIEQDKIIKLFEENLKIFIAISRSKNITPVLMTQANRIENDPNFKTERNNKELDQLYQNLYIKFNNSIRKIALEQNILLIDLAKQIPGDKKYIYDVVHFNKEGSVLAGKLIANQLAPLIIKLNKLK